MAAIVVVAGEAQLRALARDFLLAEGYAVSEVRTLEEALRIATGRAAQQPPSAEGLLPGKPRDLTVR